MSRIVITAGLRTTRETLKQSMYAALSNSSVGSTAMDYEEAVHKLNSLQTNAALLKEYKQTGYRSQTEQAKNVYDTEKYIVRSGISLDQLDQLSVIHVAGTKGKGSTCAFCESVLRHYGYKTGFFSSPHLVDVRERIRINGHPLSKQHFSKYFFEVYNRLDINKEVDADMPPYFKFLTVMAFYTFLMEKVDVAIVEVGIGGEHDCTNVLRKVKTVGITSLGIDHTNLLGTTISEIAWQKAGIMKSGCVAFTSSGQPDEALEVLLNRAQEKQCTLKIAPSLERYAWGSFNLELGVKCNVQQLNASLALQLANHWIEHNDMIKGNPRPLPHVKAQNNLETAFPISLPMALGLKHCHWPGRTQIIEKKGKSYFLDGAHTEESMVVCVEWFCQVTNYKVPHRSSNARKTALIFNSTGFRNPAQLLEKLCPCQFHMVIFCPNTVSVTAPDKPDLANFMVTEEHTSQRCLKHKEIWLKLSEQSFLIKDQSSGVLIKDSVKVVPCVQDALSLIEREEDEFNVLITGSLLLVGAVLSVLDPHLTKTYGCPMD